MFKKICTQGKESTIHKTLSTADSKYIKKEGGSAKESSKITATNNAAQLILDHISTYLDSAGKIGTDMFCSLVKMSMVANDKAHNYQPTACRTFFKEKMPPVYKRERGKKISR